MGTDSDWEKWGRTAPYFGVLSEERFRSDTLHATDREAFYRSGEDHVKAVFNTIREGITPNFSPVNVLDFGCGVGRLVIPFSRHSTHATGVDVSPSMLAEAARRCERECIDNMQLVCSGDLSGVTETYDLVHSYIVLQHIPWGRGRKLVKRLAGLVSQNGGVLAIQVLTRCWAPLPRRMIAKMRYVFPPIHWLRNLLLRKSVLEPVMQMHVYDIQTIRDDLAAQGFDQFLEVCDVGVPDFSSTFLYARKRGCLEGNAVDERPTATVALEYRAQESV